MATPFGSHINVVVEAARDSALSFFHHVFPQMARDIDKSTNEYKDLVDDLTTLYADYASSILVSEYNRLRDDIALRIDTQQGKQVFGPETSYHDRVYESDEEEDEDEDEEAEDDEDEDGVTIIDEVDEQ